MYLPTSVAFVLIILAFIGLGRLIAGAMSKK